MPLRTFKHPGDGERFSTVDAVHITTDSDIYSNMLILSLFGILVSVGFILAYGYWIKVAPEYSKFDEKVDFMESIKFVLYRF